MSPLARQARHSFFDGGWWRASALVLREVVVAQIERIALRRAKRPAFYGRVPQWKTLSTSGLNVLQTVFIGAREEEHVVVPLAMVSSQRIGKDKPVAKPTWGVHVGIKR